MYKTDDELFKEYWNEVVPAWSITLNGASSEMINAIKNSWGFIRYVLSARIAELREEIISELTKVR